MDRKNIDLDEDAEKLFREIQGIESARQLESFSQIADLLAECLRAEEATLDKWRILLVDAIHFISSYFVDVHFLEGVKSRKDNFTELLQVCTKLSTMPDGGDHILVKFRGQPRGSKIPAKQDFVATFGKLVVDSSIVHAVFKRMGLRMSHLTGRIGRAFEVFSNQGINTFRVVLPKKSHAKMKLLADSLEIISRFNSAVDSGKPIVYQSKGKRRIAMPTNDESGVPDPNLTLLAALNNLSPGSMKKLVTKVDAWRESASPGLDDRHSGVFEAVFAISSLRRKLVRPPVEMNNMKWLLNEKDRQPVSKEKAIVARHVMEKVEGPPEKKRRVLHSVYGDDYRKVAPADLGERIGDVSGLMDSLERESEDENVRQEVMDSVRDRLEDVREEVFDDLFISENTIRIRSRGRESVIEKVNAKIKEMVTFFKGRAVTRRKIKSMTHEVLEFTEEDYETVAMDFDVPVGHAKKIIQLLRACFDENGQFQRSVFEKHIPAFAKLENKVFDILWHFLKETQNRNDRVAFLNSLQHLIERMDNPEKALKVLIGDICRNPEAISYSDRNSFMLAILLVRDYNQELRLDIEITPEEVLDVKKGLNHRAAEAASEIVDTDQETVFAKIRTIHSKLLEAIVSDGADENRMPLRYMMSLEREACIFMALVGGLTARSIIRSAVKEYGDPGSDLYIAQKDPAYVRGMLQHLKVMVRALGRLEDEETMELLNGIKAKEALFQSLGAGPQHESLVRGIMERVHKVRTAIFKKTKGER